MVIARRNLMVSKRGVDIVPVQCVVCGADETYVDSSILFRKGDEIEFEARATQMKADAMFGAYVVSGSNRIGFCNGHNSYWRIGWWGGYGGMTTAYNFAINNIRRYYYNGTKVIYGTTERSWDVDASRSANYRIGGSFVELYGAKITRDGEVLVEYAPVRVLDESGKWVGALMDADGTVHMPAVGEFGFIDAVGTAIDGGGYKCIRRFSSRFSRRYRSHHKTHSRLLWKEAA